MSPEQHLELLDTLQTRFERNMGRHAGLAWDEVRLKLEAHPEKLSSLWQMEQTGGEPDVVGFDEHTGEHLFYDCAPQSPTGRRSVCFDQAALEARKAHKPDDSAMHMAETMGITLLTEEEYRYLQTLGEFDKTTSSWVATPADIRARGGALFCDRRYGHVFVYHNGADSYYGARGFRGSLRV